MLQPQSNFETLLTILLGYSLLGLFAYAIAGIIKRANTVNPGPPLVPKPEPVQPIEGIDFRKDMSIPAIEAAIALHQRNVEKYLGGFMLPFLAKESEAFIRGWMKQIDELSQSHMNAVQMRQAISHDFQQHRFPPGNGLDSFVPFLEAKLALQVQKLRERRKVADQRTTQLQVSDSGDRYRAAIRWAGDVPEELVSRVSTDFLRYTFEQVRKPAYPYAKPFDFTGVSAVHLLEQGIRRHAPDITVLEISMEQLTPEPPPPPPPPVGVLVGTGVREPAYILETSRDKTTYILGIPGMGKTTLMSAMIRQDIQSGKGVGLIDPAGDFAEAALSYVPKERIKDCVYIDPIRCPVGINFFNAKDEAERDMIAEDLLTIFKRLTEGGGERMDAVLARSVQLLAQHPGATFLDLYRLLTDTPWREMLARKSRDERLRAFWLEIYPKYPHPITEQPIISRLQKFDTNSALRTITGTTSDLDFYEAIRQRKIIIINLAKSRIKDGPAQLLGALFVSQFQLAAFRQGELPLAERIPFYLYVDEFQNFSTSAFNTIITEARKFKLCMTLANQKLADLDDQTRTAVLSAHNRVCFRLQDEDARKLGSSMGDFAAAELMNVDEFECVMRPGKPSDTVKVRITIPPRHEFDHAAEIIAMIQRLYRRPHEDEAVLAVSDDPEPSAPPD